MPNLSDKRLEQLLGEAIKPDTIPSSDLKAEIWNGLLAKLEERPAPQPIQTEIVDVSARAEKITVVQRITEFLFATLEQSGTFLFADVIPFERARQQMPPQSYYWVRWHGHIAVA